MDLIADTTFLVGLWRKQPWAVDFAKANSHRILGVPWVALGEFWHGAIKAGHDREVVRQFLLTGMPICDTAPVVPFYAAVCVSAQDEGFYGDIGQSDLWIAATALSRNLPLISRNKRHFGRIKGLRVEALLE